MGAIGVRSKVWLLGHLRLELASTFEPFREDQFHLQRRRTDANTTLVDDPELTLQIVLMQCRDQTRRNFENMCFVLASKTKNDEAGVRFWCVRSDIREAAIKRYENSILSIADVSDSWVV